MRLPTRAFHLGGLTFETGVITISKYLCRKYSAAQPKVVCWKQKWRDETLQSTLCRTTDDIVIMIPWTLLTKNLYHTLQPMICASLISERYGKADGKKQVHFHSTAYYGWAISKGERGTLPGENIYGSTNSETLAM